jgi:hypothetical protein
VDALTIRRIIDRDDVQEAMDRAIHDVHAAPHQPPIDRAALIALAQARLRKALVTDDGSPPLLVFVREVVRRALESQPR